MMRFTVSIALGFNPGISILSLWALAQCFGWVKAQEKESIANPWLKPGAIEKSTVIIFSFLNQIFTKTVANYWHIHNNNLYFCYTIIYIKNMAHFKITSIAYSKELYKGGSYNQFSGDQYFINVTVGTLESEIG